MDSWLMDRIRFLSRLNWAWTFEYVKKRFFIYSSYFISAISSRRYWEADIDGTKVKLAFSHPYHHHFARILSKGGHEESLLRLWKEKSRELGEGVVFDVGGYNGVYGLISALSSPKSEVYIFEPDPINFEHIKRNIELNRARNARAVQCALSGTSGEVCFRQHSGGTGGSIRQEDGDTDFKARSITIDDWARENNKAPKLMKFDISGAEHNALLAAEKTLRSARKMGILLEHYSNPSIQNQKERDERFWSFMEGLGYKSAFLYPRGDGMSRYYFLYKNL